MTEITLFLIASAFTVAVASFISYSGAEEPYVKLALGAIMLSAAVSGALGFIEEAADILPMAGGDIYTEGSLTEEVAKGGFEEGVRAFISSELSLPLSEIEVEAKGFSEGSMNAKIIKVTLFGKSAFSDPSRVERLIEENGLGECEVNISFERKDQASDRIFSAR